MNWQPQMNWLGSQGARNRVRGGQTRAAESLESRALLAIDVSTFSPADNASGVLLGSNLELTFSEAVEPGPGAGRVLIYDKADSSLVESVSVRSSQVTFSGSKVTIDPAADLKADKDYYVLVDAGAVRSKAGGPATNQVIFQENFENLNVVDSKLSDDGIFDPALDFNNYTVAFRGTLDVLEAGEYTFVASSDDGGYLLIDLDQDGSLVYEALLDQVINDDSTHGVTNKFSTVLFPASSPLTLALGKYNFEFVYFEGGGGSSGELSYAKGTLDTFDAEKFVLVGDKSKGIDITADGITATTYKAADATFNVNNLTAARSLITGATPAAAGFPVSAKLPTVNVTNTGGDGNFGDGAPVPGAPIRPRAENTDWAPVGPAGFTFNQLYDGQPITNDQKEYDGWTFLDKNFWINQQGNQERVRYTLGQNIVAVMDPDAYDDFKGIGNNTYEAYMTLPEISLDGVAAKSVKINFDSSYRPEGPTGGIQSALVDVSYDAGSTWTRVLELRPEQFDLGAEGGDLVRINSAESITVDNPAGGSMLVRFGSDQAGNDWWWAIDNVKIVADTTSETYAGIADRAKFNFDTKVSAFPGDINGDRKVDINDFVILRRNFGKTGQTKAEGDLTNDSKVDINDFIVLRTNFGKSAPAAAQDVAVAGAAASAALQGTGLKLISDEDALNG